MNQDNEFFTKNQIDSRNCTFGDYTYGKPKILEWDNATRLTVGKYCSISDDVTFILGGNHRSDWITTYPFPALSQFWPKSANITGHPATNGDIKVGSDVWIGYGATIMSGVEIGHGAIIAAKALVAKDVPPYAIVGGNPAKVIRYRFDQDVISGLLKQAWWEWPHNMVEKNVESLCEKPTSEFLKLRKKLFESLRNR